MGALKCTEHKLLYRVVGELWRLAARSQHATLILAQGYQPQPERNSFGIRCAVERHFCRRVLSRFPAASAI